jgi:hypothetical protein
MPPPVTPACWERSSARAARSDWEAPSPTISSATTWWRISINTALSACPTRPIFPIPTASRRRRAITGTYPTLPAAAAGGFPYTPPAIAAITGTFLGISPDLKTPYSIMFNANYSRELPGKVVMEVGYVGRLSRRLLMQGDVYTPDENYKDPGSGITWQQNAQTVYNLANSLARSAGVPTTTRPPWWRRK